MVLLVLVLVVVWLKEEEEKGIEVGTHICRDERH